MKLHYFISNIYLLIVCGTILHGQEVNQKSNSILGKFAEMETLSPLSDVVVQLLDAGDSSLIKTELSDQLGTFKFSGLEPGKYFIKATLLGYSAYISEPILASGDVLLPSIILTKSTVRLDEVVIQYKKPFLEREQGKVIMNVENSINAEGSSVFDLIEKAPGITVSQSDNISYKGKQGIIVQINGKEVRMGGTDLANYLRGLSSSSIEKVEFIANPSSKYDAAGSSIINIILKKDKRLGTNATITDSYGQGKYPKTNSGISLNHRTRKVNLFASYNYAYRKGFNHLVLDRDFLDADTLTASYVQDNKLIFPIRNHTARAGADFFINSKNTIGIELNGVSNKFKPNGENISDVYDHKNMKSSSFRTSNRSDDTWYNYSGNLNFKHTFDSTGSELTMDIDYAHYGNTTEQNFTTRYYNLENIEYKPAYLLYGDIHGGLDIYSLKSDYSRTLKNQLKLETGIKSSYVIADNNLKFYDLSNTEPIYDFTKSNHFIYKENIIAVYATLSKEFGKWNFQFGLRGENTTVNGEQKVTNATFDTSYIQLFPSGFISYKLNDNNSFELNYSRRINRPSYKQLNPFKFFLDPSTYTEGNPYLKPETTHSLELTHVYRQKLYTTMSWGRTVNNLTDILLPSPNLEKTTVQTIVNLGYLDVYSLAVSYPAKIADWWSLQTDFTAYYAAYNGKIANTTLSNSGRPTMNINLVNNFNLSKTVSADISGFYQSRELHAFDNINPIWQIAAGLQKKLWNNKATVKLNITDIAFSGRMEAVVNFRDYQEHFVVTRDSRVATLSFTYKFGNSNIASGPRRQGGADDVKQRAN
ncbi:MAG: TonB-dependent receptor [Saprospiraceae bacterium]|nr:TonB-dependent receptor [Saprospiraceae bacterium]